MAFEAGCRQVMVDPIASDVGSDRADIEICDFCNNGKLVWLDVRRGLDGADIRRNQDDARAGRCRAKC